MTNKIKEKLMYKCENIKILDFDSLDKSNSYCYKCFLENCLTKLKSKENRLEPPNCVHFGKGFHRLSFVKKYNCWLPVVGLSFEAKSKKEILDQMKEPGLCSICEICNNLRDQNGRGKDNCDCSKDWFQKHNSSDGMRQQAVEAGKIFGVQNLINYNKSDAHKETASKIGLKTCKVNFKRSVYFCEKCQEDTIHKALICVKCTPYANSGLGWHIEFCDKCNKSTIHNGGSCIQCDPLSAGSVIPTFIEYNDQLYYYNRKNNSMIEWNKYKEEFLQLQQDQDIFIYDGFYLVFTFRDKDSCDWSGSKIAFEQFLIEKGINWFVYIKFYIDNNKNIKPLVVGKSGSLNVNNRGSDISFSTDINHGPGRRFLNDNGFVWDKTQIAVFNCCSEKEAYDKEKEFAIKYELFGS